MLRFFAFFDEPVPNSPNETSRVRKFEILYYVNDGTLEVNEPKTGNSGLAQGAYLKRMRVPKGPTPPPGAPPVACVGAADLAVGADVSLFGRVFHVCGADASTRAHYAVQGTPLAPDVTMPDSVLDVARALAAANIARTHTASAVQAGVQFLQNDGKVLSFPGMLFDAAAEGGARSIVFRWYLGDGTAEVSEPGAGLLLHRQRMPLDLPSTGVAALGPDPNARFMRAETLRVGDRLRVFARELQLLDADPFTRSWYESNLGVTQPPAMAGPAQAAPRPKAALPPHNGYGSPEDSLRNCLSLVPKPSSADKAEFKQYMQFSGKVLRFAASMRYADPSKKLDPSDEGRLFTVNFFMEDETLSIFEPQQSDRPASRFLERTRVNLPGTETSLRTTNLRVGAELSIFGRVFTLTTCDGFTEQMMAAHPELWA